MRPRLVYLVRLECDLKKIDLVTAMRYEAELEAKFPELGWSGSGTDFITRDIDWKVIVYRKTQAYLMRRKVQRHLLSKGVSSQAFTVTSKLSRHEN